jgi:hypothetical protein
VQLVGCAVNQRHVRLVYQPPASSTFLSEQISHQQPANSIFLSEQISTSHQHQPNKSSYIYSWGVHERKIIWFLKEESPRITFQSTIAKV